MKINMWVSIKIVGFVVAAIFIGVKSMAGESGRHADVVVSTAVNDAESVSQVVYKYFDYIRSRNPDVHLLFHHDAVLNGLKLRTHGRPMIKEFYDQAIATGAPQPKLVPPLLVGGHRVAAEIYIDLADGRTLHVIDLFEIEDGLIRSLTYFLSDEL